MAQPEAILGLLLGLGKGGKKWRLSLFSLWSLRRLPPRAIIVPSHAPKHGLQVQGKGVRGWEGVREREQISMTVFEHLSQTVSYLQIRYLLDFTVTWTNRSSLLTSNLSWVFL